MIADAAFYCRTGLQLIVPLLSIQNAADRLISWYGDMVILFHSEMLETNSCDEEKRSSGAFVSTKPLPRPRGSL